MKCFSQQNLAFRPYKKIKKEGHEPGHYFDFTLEMLLQRHTKPTGK